MAYNITDAYFDRLAQVESGNRPFIKASTSSASGLFQFIKSTWQNLGGSWGSDPSKAFGGLRPSEAEQRQRINTFTQQNAQILAGAGVPLTGQNLYAAHFLGAGTAKKILGAADGAAVSGLVGSGVVSANPFLRGMTVGDFKAWLDKKFGGVAGVASGGGFRHCGFDGE